uniref:U3 small nucleolar RNA-associated protein 11 n=1 Tax=Panagrellus redivivus TaxID=6233 RepID=A0A7E4VHU0_PANRE
MSLRKAAKVGQRIHKDRTQPLGRESFGYLEHKKDWLERARDQNEKKKKIKHLRQKALERNPDEYHHHMVRSEIKANGIHRELDPDSDDETLLQKQFEGIRDLHYVKHKLAVEKKKIESLKASLHLAGAETPQNSHIVFVDDEEEARNFDPAEYFNTDPALLGRSYNRLPKDALNKKAINAESKEDVKETEKKRRGMYKMLKLRLERERELKIVLDKLQLKKDLADSRNSELKPTLEKKGTATKAAVYKWKYDRKK